MWIREEIQPARSLSDDPYSHSGCDEIHKVSDDLASGVEFQDNGRLDVEAEEDCANGHQKNPSESRKDGMNDNNMVDIL